MKSFNAFSVLLAVFAVILAGPVYAGEAGPALQSYRMSVKAPNQPAVALHVVEGGQGPAIALLHGLGASSYMWRRLMPKLALNHRVIAIDLRGFGLSDKPIDFRYRIEDHAALVEALLHELGVTRVTLVGHSFGGAVALILASRSVGSASARKLHVTRLILMNSPAFPQPPSNGVAFLQKPVVPYIALNLLPPEKAAMMALRSVDGSLGGLTAQDLAAYAKPFQYRGTRHALIQTARNIEPRNFEKLISTYADIRVPSLLIWCRQDPVVPLAIGIRLRNALPSAKLKILDDCRHVPIEQTPTKTKSLVIKFLSETKHR